MSISSRVSISAQFLSESGCEAMRRESRGSIPALVVAFFALAGGGIDPAPAGEREPSSRVSELLSILRAASSGVPSAETAPAWRELSTAGVDTLPAILAAMDGANPIAMNWIRSAADAVAERGLRGGGELPAGALESFVKDRSHEPRARRTAYEWLLRVDATAAGRLIPGMLHDPGVEFRRDAVARLLERASAAEKAGRREQAIARYREALDGARDADQVRTIAAGLRGLGQEVDLPTHFGFLMAWKLVGPFDNSEREGFDRVFPPEQGVDLSTSYEGLDGRVSWSDYRSSDDYGLVDLNRALAKKKSVLAYAYTVFTSAGERELEFRLSTVNAWKLWLNGELLFAHDEYHHGTGLDHYRVQARMKSGENRILLKICQNEQTESYAVHWRFQIRVCDSGGSAILSTTRAGELEEAGEK